MSDVAAEVLRRPPVQWATYLGDCTAIAGRADRPRPPPGHRPHGTAAVMTTETFPQHAPCRTLVLPRGLPVDEDLDLSDLDLLDDEHRHGRCSRCGGGTGTMKRGVVFTAMCGARAIWLRPLPPKTPPTPPDACPACADLLYGPCPVCGVAT